jgi:hypothetical protein
MIFPPFEFIPCSIMESAMMKLPAAVRRLLQHEGKDGGQVSALSIP